ncbi:hypothetical protein [Roseivirga sp.]|uniref:hypothetical protein n=1 Tax=Roseivirga sp. TaxID=1964215 RepID=UPI002B26703F|nr:hypothetical protein [Roseivirga sp.]
MKDGKIKKIPMGYEMETFRDLPKDVITHMPFIIFAPKRPVIAGEVYVPMHFLYIFKNLDVFSEEGYKNGHVFDQMPPNSTLSFKSNFKEDVGYSVIRATYYFNVNLGRETLKFKMNISESDKIKYNLANRDNRLALTGNSSLEFMPEFFTEECDVNIPPPTA